MANAAPIKVACVGDSITYGFEIPNRAVDSYPAQIQKLLGNKYEVRNFGVNGATLLRKGHRPYDLTKAFKQALAFHPDIVIIHLGINDTDPRDWPDFRDEFRADYSWLIAQFRAANPKAEIDICAITPIFEQHPRYKSGTHTWAKEIRAQIPQIAQANQTGLIDFYTPLIAFPNYFNADGVHPTPKGAGVLAKTVEQAITGNYGGLQLSAGFGDHMVLQHGVPLKISGRANRNQIVTFQFQNHTFRTRADLHGNWSFELPTQKPGGPFTMAFSANGKKITVSDICFGALWVCSGQSNMDFRVSECSPDEVAAAMKTAKNPMIRLLHYDHFAVTNNRSWNQETLEKANDLQWFSGHWEQANETNVKQFSAVGYFFAEQLQRALKMPVGIIQVAVGGSGTEAWIDRPTMDDDPLLVDMIPHWRTSDFIMQWCRQRAAVNLKNAKNPEQRHPYQPCYGFEAGIKPILNLHIKGVIWYQGESNTQNMELFEHLFPTMVKSWRQNWGYNFPFFYVQLSGLNRPSWPRFRDAQRRLLNQIPNSGMVVSSDLGEPKNVHYHHKQPVGDRMAKLVEQQVYHLPGVHGESPLPLTVKRSGNQLVIQFRNGDGELQTANGKPLSGFQVRDAKGDWHQIAARINGSSVVLESPQMQQMKAVAYAWKPFPDANLVNAYKLPASTFILPLR